MNRRPETSPTMGRMCPKRQDGAVLEGTTVAPPPPTFKAGAWPQMLAVMTLSAFLFGGPSMPPAYGEGVAVKVGFEGHEVELDAQPGLPATLTSPMPAEDDPGLEKLLPRSPNNETAAAPVQKSFETGGKPKTSGNKVFKHDGLELPPSNFLPGDTMGELTATGRVAVYGITFAINSANIEPTSIPSLDRVLRLLQSKMDMKLIIEGHTDDSGEADFNFWISVERAEAVKRWLIERGIDPARLRAMGYGETAPREDNANAEAKPRNRRVEFVVDK